MISKWRKNEKRLRVAIVVVLALLLSTVLVLAAGEMMPRHVLSGGGGSVTNGTLTLQSAIGQPIVGAVSGDGVLCSGFWCGPGAPGLTTGSFANYLPIAIKP